MATRLEPGELVRIRRAILVRGALFAAPVGTFAAAYFALWQPPSGDYPWIVQLFINVAQSLGFLVVILFAGNLLVRRWLSRHRSWVASGEPVTPEDRDALVSLPSRAAGWILAANFCIVVGGSVVNASISTPVRQVIGYAIFFLLLGFTFAAIVYLQTERALRPLYARAFEASLPTRRTVGVMPRLSISWAVGSAVPLLFVAILPLRPSSSRDLPLTAPMLYMSIGGLLIGGMTAALSSRSVATPVEMVRAGLERVRDGYVDTNLEVTHPGDLGALQAGFNEMVDAMRSRREIEDLFGRHVGEDVAREALRGGVQLGGEFREVSVLFADLIGSSSLAEEQPPHAVVALVNSIFDAVVAEIGAEGGWVNKFEGDGCLCVFGAPVTYEDHAARALRAARRLSDRLRAMELNVGIGVSSGEVVAGNVGALSRFEYTVIGRPVNEAARLTDAAKLEPGKILASARTIALAGAESSNWTEYRAFELRGMRDPVATSVPNRGVHETRVDTNTVSE